MNSVHPVALYLSHAEYEASIISAITERSPLLTVIRRCADAAELEAVVRSGLAKYVAIGANEPEVDRQLLERLHLAGAKILLLILPNDAENTSSEALQQLGADGVAYAQQTDTVMRALHLLVSPIEHNETVSLVTEPESELDIEFHKITESESPGSPSRHHSQNQPPEESAQPQGKRRKENNEELTDKGTSPVVLTDLPTRSHRHSSSKRLFFSRESRADATLETTGREQNGRVILAYGTSGSPGRSTIAANLAAELARTARVLLVDADTHAPSIAHSLGLDVDGSSLAALARAHARGTVSLVHCEEVAYDGPGGLHILTGLNTPHRWRELSPSALSGILQAARHGWDYIVVDVAAVTFELLEDYQQHIPRRDALVARAVEEADQVLVVARADALGLHRLRHAWEWLDEQGVEAPRLPVINMADTYRCGARPIHSIAVALSELIPGTDVTVIPYDTAVLQAGLRGQLLKGKAKKNARAAITDLAARVATSAPVEVSIPPASTNT